MCKVDRRDDGEAEMRAWILDGQASIEERPLKLVEVPTPHARDLEIRVKVEACGVCRTDIHIAEGDLALKRSPLILGHEIVGTVDQVGEGVTRFQVGDRAGVQRLLKEIVPEYGPQVPTERTQEPVGSKTAMPEPRESHPGD